MLRPTREYKTPSIFFCCCWTVGHCFRFPMQNGGNVQATVSKECQRGDERPIQPCAFPRCWLAWFFLSQVDAFFFFSLFRAGGSPVSQKKKRKSVTVFTFKTKKGNVKRATVDSLSAHPFFWVGRLKKQTNEQTNTHTYKCLTKCTRCCVHRHNFVKCSL